MKIGDLLSTMGITQEMLAAFTAIPRSRIARWSLANIEPPKAADQDVINGFYEAYKDKSSSELRDLYNDIVKKGTIDTDDFTKTGEEIRKQKAYGEKKQEDEGVGFVPIAAQAGYSVHYLEPKFIDELPVIRIPGLPYKGRKYRVFEVDGDSMEPTLKQHYHVLGERIDQEYWDSIANYYIYVIVTIDQVLIKRIFSKKGFDTFVLISDNKDFYPQFTMHKKDIKELWLVKRKMDWEMPPPYKVEIDEDLLEQ